MFLSAARKDPFYVNVDHPDNASVLKLLEMPPTTLRTEDIRYFEQCIEYLLRVNPNAKGDVNGYPVYAQLDSGVILVAVINIGVVALRYTSTGFREAAIEAGAKDSVETNGQVIQLGDDWIFTDGSLDLKSVRHDLPLAEEYYSAQVRDARINASLAEATARGNETLVRADHSSNAAFIKHFQELNPKAIPSAAPPKGYGMWGLGVHPDVPEYLWHELPRKASLPEDMGWMVHGVLVLVHPTSGVIFAFIRGTSVLALRLPDSIRSEMALRPTADVEPFKELGEDWVGFKPFVLQQESTSWINSAYKYAAES